ncbi:conserved membrane protein, unknown function [Hepatocystis sp. ex Piliocolobus tephrosceles]|nr:conserved membrane protein, unknown function [Hepatocystis sp. ex Piliocolobus tephrosceles]
MRKFLTSKKNIFKREGEDSSNITKLIRNISPLFFMSEFLYILFLRYNDYILSTRYKTEINENVRKNIYNILILSYFLKPAIAFLTDNIYFSINNIFRFIFQKIYELYIWIEQVFYYCVGTLYKGKYIFFKIFFGKYMKDVLSSASKDWKKKYDKYYNKKRENICVDNFLYLPLNRKYCVIISEFITILLLLLLYFFINKINYNCYLAIVFVVLSQMLLLSCVFEGILVKRCKKYVPYEQVFYISYVMCIKIFCSLILYYIYILKVSIFILFFKSCIIFILSCISTDNNFLSSNLQDQHNLIMKKENGNIYMNNTVDILSQFYILKKTLINENLFKILFFLILFNSPIDTKLSILQYGVQTYNWPHSLINYIPLVSQASKLIGISIFQLYTNKKCYKTYAMIIILLNVLLKITNFIFLYYNKNSYISPFLFLFNIIVQNVSIKILAMPILLLCIQKAPLNLESTIINIYIFCFNFSNLISKRYFIWNVILHMSKNVFIILLLSFLTTCASLLYYLNISLDSLNNDDNNNNNNLLNSPSWITSSTKLHTDEKKYMYSKLNITNNYFNTNLFNQHKQMNLKNKNVHFENENIKVENHRKDEKKSKNNLFKISPNYDSDSDQWMIIDNLKGNMRRTYLNQK